MVTGWHEGPMWALDFESTGVDVEADRAVTAALLRRKAGDPDVSLSWVINPGIPIPGGAAQIHGITTEIAQRDGASAASAIAEIRAAVAPVLAGGEPLVIFNAPFDTTLLDRECRRQGVEPLDLTGALIVDPLVLWKALDRYRRGSRKLTAACECFGVPLGDAAHEAGADALAAMRVAWKLAVKYPRLAAMPPAELMAFQSEAKWEQAASFEKYLAEIGKPEKISGDWPLIPWRGEA